ncbi:MAG: shikimate dehydrogenase [Caldilineaceae bacterium]
MTPSSSNSSPKTFYFVGVTTGQSSIQRIFPRWMEVLQRTDVTLQGVDFPLHADPARYRALVQHIKHDANGIGGLVTSHKIDLYNAAHDLFDELDPYARLCAELSSIAKRDGRLVGHAIDPIAMGQALNMILGDRYFGRTGGEVLCLGAGGAATAIALHLINQTAAADRPQRFTLVDIAAERLAHAQRMVAQMVTDIAFNYLHHDQAASNDALVARLPAGSVIINATGMGKDRPGSPVTDGVNFPQAATVWELNYRGTLTFLHQALAQRNAQQLIVSDGWVAFLYGWTGVIAQVLDLPIDDDLFAQMAHVAAEHR